MIKPEQSCMKRFFTYNLSGVLTDDDGTPVGVLVKNGTDTAETVTVTKITTGVYKAEWNIPSDAVPGDFFELQIAVTMSTVVQKDIVWSDSVDNYSLSDIFNAVGFEKIIPSKMIIPAEGSKAYMIAVLVDNPDNAEVGIQLLAGDNSILYEDDTLTTALSASVAFEDYLTMVTLNANIHICYVEVADDEVLEQLNYIFTYAKNGVEVYHTACTVLVHEAAVGADLIAIKEKTSQLTFTQGGDVKATLDGEKVTVSSIDADVITAAAIKADAVTEIQAGLATSVELGLVDDKIDTLDTNLDSLITTVGVAGAGLTALGDIRLANLDDTITSRMATFTYTAPDNQSIIDIKAITDKVNFDINDNILSSLTEEDILLIKNGLATELHLDSIEDKIDALGSFYGSGSGGTGGEEVDITPLVEIASNIYAKQTETSDTMINLLNHVHLQHLHPKAHDTAATDETLGDPPSTPAPPKVAEIFLQELLNGQDLDGNNLIFGIDFIVRGDDVPMLLLKSTNIDTYNPNAQSYPWSEAKEGIFIYPTSQG